ncbi:MAG: hypothetical protein ABIQ17_02020 [Candidatus Limnocylindrales bacterium]
MREVPAASQAPEPPAVVAHAPVPTPGRAPLLADLPGEAPKTLAGWLVLAGSWVGAMSFLLPWAPGIADYTSSWGFASLANLPILALLIVTTVVAILPNRIPTWIRSGVLGLVGGSLLLGILWPYVVGDFGSAFGSLVGAVAALVLIVGGVLAVAPSSERTAT